MRQRTRDLFPPDRGLQARMVAALLLNLGVLVAALSLVAWLLVAVEAGWIFVAVPAAVAVFGLIQAQLGTYYDTAGYPRYPRPEERRVVEDSVRRLCLLADIEEPAVEIVSGRVPASWTVVSPRRRELRVTTSLLDCLTESELQAVVAHELSHLAHRDALAMAVLAGPSLVVLRGVRYMFGQGPAGGFSAAVLGAFLGPPALLLTAISRVVSRHRELAADRGAAVLIGSPSALSAALLRIAGELERLPGYERRGLAFRDPFHVLPVRPPGRLRALRAPWATHPSLDRRLAQLEGLESGLQGARRRL